MATQATEMQSKDVIALDWDDTILATTEVLRDPEGTSTLRTEKYARDLLTTALQLGTVYIVTASAPGWVRESCETYLPSCLALLKDIPVISARAFYEKHVPEDQRDTSLNVNLVWKSYTFAGLACHLSKLGRRPRSVLAVGDNPTDALAARAVSKHLSEAWVKTVQFCPHPSTQVLAKQQRLLTRKLPVLLESEHNLHVNMHRSAPRDTEEAEEEATHPAEEEKAADTPATAGDHGESTDEGESPESSDESEDPCSTTAA
mmetsp:Transcript_123274/g.282622  ORF Transcript_123274/g.282622 Transcript_123274/m.282622 type:complete len:260 (+) Transcript_123274:387-1166(+)